MSAILVISFNILVGTSNTTIDQVVSTAATGANYSMSGSGSPEGVVQGSPGYTYWDLTNGTFYVKNTGTGTTGWQSLIQL